MSEEDQIRMLDDLNQEGINRILSSSRTTTGTGLLAQISNSSTYNTLTYNPIGNSIFTINTTTSFTEHSLWLDMGTVTIPYRVDQELPKYNFFTACKLVKE